MGGGAATFPDPTRPVPCRTPKGISATAGLASKRVMMQATSAGEDVFGRLSKQAVRLAKMFALGLQVRL